MKQGKKICETLKAIRRDIASANEIDYQPNECTHKGDCAGTCPACESEMRWIERQLLTRQALGKAVTIAGLSVAFGAMSSCHPKIFQPDGKIAPRYPENTDVNTQNTNSNVTPPSANFTSVDTTEAPVQLMGDVVRLPEPEQEPAVAPSNRLTGDVAIRQPEDQKSGTKQTSTKKTSTKKKSSTKKTSTKKKSSKK